MNTATTDRERDERQRHAVARDVRERSEPEEQREIADTRDVRIERQPFGLPREQRDERNERDRPAFGSREEPRHPGDRDRDIEAQLDRQRPQRSR
jgi:hypothetical protein